MKTIMVLTLSFAMPAVAATSAVQNWVNSLKPTTVVHRYANTGQKVGPFVAQKNLDVFSPKSVRFSQDGRKIWVNALAGFETLSFSWPDLRPLSKISHVFGPQQANLFQADDFNTLTREWGYRFFQHVAQPNFFKGKPVESELSHNGRYLWVPYYRRDWDPSAQSPSAIAIIDAERDEIIRVMNTGPLAKYVVSSPDSSTTAVIHWGDNSVGLIDTRASTPSGFRYLANITIDYKLSMAGVGGTDRDRNCGLCLRGAVFTPNGRYLLVARMGGQGLAAIDVEAKVYLGTISNILPARHLTLSKNGEWLYASSNSSGVISKIHFSLINNAIYTLQMTYAGKPQAIPFVEQANLYKKAFVGSGARTLALGFQDQVVFVAVNTSSQLVALDAESMTQMKSWPVSAYAVGLAVSPNDDGVIVTSQGQDAVSILSTK